jgi:hypothetical protein
MSAIVIPRGYSFNGDQIDVTPSTGDSQIIDISSLSEKPSAALISVVTINDPNGYIIYDFSSGAGTVINRGNRMDLKDSLFIFGFENIENFAADVDVVGESAVISVLFLNAT